ncbi:serine/threonine protein kinase [bacterium]|nr:serine/threonine protein kinase [bacterium]
MSLAPGQVLQDRYRVVRIIKSGGMGSVYEAIDGKLADSPCAIKEILDEAKSGQDADYIQARFYEEMKALSGLDHPAIPKVRDYLTLNSNVYIVMDLIQGKSLLEEVMESNQPLHPELVAQDMLQLLDALVYLHSHDPPIIHRDIKPANILRDRRSGMIKLVDFGLARQVQGLKTQTMVGTMGYSAPEQMMGKSEPRSDLYSVGVTLEHLLTGKIPQPNLLQGHRIQRSGLRPGLAEIVERATQPTMDHRFRSARQMAEALGAWVNNTTPLTQTVAPITGPTQTSHGMQKLGAILALLLAAGVGVVVGRHRPAVNPQASATSPPQVAVQTVATLATPRATPIASPQLPEAAPTPAEQDQTPLTDYLAAIGAELKVVQQLGQQAQAGLTEISQEVRPGEGENTLRAVLGKLQQLKKLLVDSRQRLAEVATPAPARRLQGLMHRNYDLCQQCLDQAEGLCQQGQTSLQSARSGPPGLHKMRRFQQTARELQGQVRALQAALTQAQQQTFLVMEEVQSVAKKAHLKP